MKAAIFLLLSAPVLLWAQVEPFFAQGNAHYQNGNYEDAIAAYQTVVQAGFESAELYYNMGNAYFKQNEIGEAVLFYEKALKLAPRDADIAYNLGLAQLYVVDRVETPPPFFIQKYWQGVLYLFSRTQLALWTLVIYLISVGLWTMRLLLRRRKGWLIISRAAAEAGIVFIVFLFLLLARERRERTEVFAVVMQERVEVLSGPAVDSTPVFALHEGVKVQLGPSSGEYVQISLADGKVGWLPKETVEKI
ncbi:MAG TPA: tetratricopeptide repeat protein [bacterium]|nr:tetratricopeptide repeat protein [bacterium]